MFNHEHVNFNLIYAKLTMKIDNQGFSNGQTHLDASWAVTVESP